MRKIVFILIISLPVLLNITEAQKGEYSVDIGLSEGLFSNYSNYNNPFGGDFRVYKGLTSNGSLIFNLNFTQFHEVAVPTGGPLLISYKLGYKTLINNSRFSLSAAGGATFILISTGSNPNKFSLNTGIGYSVPISKHNQITLSSTYNIVFQNTNKLNWLDLTLSYGIPLPGLKKLFHKTK